MCRHAGVAGYRLGAGRTINVPSISLDRPSLRNTSHYCKSLFKHGQRVATMKNWLLRLGWWHQQRIDGGYNVNCMFFSMHGVSKMLEWSIIRVRWANRRLGQCAGEWRSCEGFSPHFFVAVVVSGQHNEVPPRGDAGVRRLIFTIIGTSFLFFWSPSLWSPSFWCKTLLSHGQKCFNNKTWVVKSSLSWW